VHVASPGQVCCCRRLLCADADADAGGATAEGMAQPAIHRLAGGSSGEAPHSSPQQHCIGTALGVSAVARLILLLDGSAASLRQ
jgi:hypothetical protein